MKHGAVIETLRARERRNCLRFSARPWRKDRRRWFPSRSQTWPCTCGPDRSPSGAVLEYCLDISSSVSGPRTPYRRRSRPVISLGCFSSEESENGGRNILQRAAGAQSHARFVHQDERHGIGGVISVRTLGDGIDHRFGVAVIGRDHPRSAGAAQRGVDFAEARVHRLHGSHGRRHFPGVPHHVGVGVIHDDDVEARAVRSPSPPPR